MRGLDDILRELSINGADVALRSIGWDKQSLKHIRLACRTTRNFVDVSTRTLRITLTPKTPPPSLHQRPALTRWPRVEELTITVEESPQSGSIATLLALPFLGAPATALSGITSLTLSAKGPNRSAFIPPPVFSQLATALPNLRTLNLLGLGDCFSSYTPLDLSLMYCGLAGLEALDYLLLPAAALLPGIEALAGSLERLHLTTGGSAEREQLTPACVASLQQLRKLTGLTCRGSVNVEPSPSTDAAIAARGGLVGLLAQPPPALQELDWTLTWPDLNDLADMKIAWGGAGRMARVTLSYIPLDRVAALAREALMPCQASGSSKPLLVLDNPALTHLSASDLEDLRALVELYNVRFLTPLTVAPSTDQNLLEEVLRVFGRVPQLAFAGFPAELHSITFQTGYPTAQPGGQTGPHALPLPSVMIVKALEAVAENQPESDSDAEVEEGEDNDEYGPLGPKQKPVLLVSGPAAAALSQQGRRVLRKWATELRPKAAALAAGAGQAEGGGSGVLLSGVQALPPAAALLVECGEAAVAAAAVAAALKGEGLNVVLLPRKAIDVDDDLYLPLDDSSAGNHLHFGLQQVMPAVWDEAAAAGVTLSQRLEWALAVQEMVEELPYISIS
ncbi:hypothetical protein HYH03_005551 [Edaphochlamys debaryana]|uniref:Uncharacterized protein n=1 Tax=Edaphochlamys debaryana TaxID=47281 RepID=A0A835Y715_9CHLO|nr:hypothetical protein HYH03_005551 [Edaphochlamys debaryana]|eukprot:KAG2496319.1 hypothetical protein HYH03_005551 [Edaphochlamys debaryana]